MLPNEKAILLIRGEKPVVDLKYDILKHPNVKYTADGNAEFYKHGVVDRATGTIDTLTLEDLSKLKDTKDEMKEIENITYELLSEEDIENYIKMEDFENERKKESNKENEN